MIRSSLNVTDRRFLQLAPKVCLLLSKHVLWDLYQTATWDKSNRSRKRSIWPVRLQLQDFPFNLHTSHPDAVLVQVVPFLPDTLVRPNEEQTPSLRRSILGCRPCFVLSFLLLAAVTTTGLFLLLYPPPHSCPQSYCVSIKDEFAFTLVFTLVTTCPGPNLGVVGSSVYFEGTDTCTFMWWGVAIRCPMQSEKWDLMWLQAPVSRGFHIF